MGKKKENLSVEKELTFFDIFKMSEDPYIMAEHAFGEQGININIEDMDVIPVKVDGEYVTFRFIPTEYSLK